MNRTKRMRLIVISLLLFGFMQTVYGQEKSILGKVTGEDLSPIPGVSVAVQGTSKGTITNSDGIYSISGVTSDAILVFSFVGMKTQEVAIGQQSEINVVMVTESIGLEEVVAIGYGAVKKSDLTGSVSSVKSEELKAFPTANLLQSLNGRSSGVLVKQNTGAPGAAVSIRIRGTNSIQGSNEPLYVVDGFPSAAGIADLNNFDIESIEILKDASAVAIYGSRGANGVVLITTKTGKAGKTTIDVESSIGFQNLTNKQDMMNAEEYAKFYNEQQINDGLPAYFSQDQINGFGEGFDWQDLVYESNAPITNHSLSIAGGTKKTKYSLTGGIFDQKGIISGSGYNRYSIRANISHDFSKFFAFQYSADLTKSITSLQNSQGSRLGASLISASLLAPPTLTPYNADGTYTDMPAAYPFMTEGMTNPLNFINEVTDVKDVNNVRTSAALMFRPIDGLELKIYGGIESSDVVKDYYRTRNYVNEIGYASVNYSRFTSLLNENTLSYTKTINEKHNISAVTGFTYQDFTSTFLKGTGRGFLSDVTETYDLGAADIPGVPQSGYTKSILLSYLGRVNYSYNGRYLLTASIRADGSSKYSEGNKWGYFPSAALAWKIIEEEFLKDVSFLSDLKLRGSWGITGSQAISAYATMNNLYSGKTVFGDSQYTTMSPGISYPGDLKWESTEQINVGIDAAFFDNRLQVTADYYAKNTTDLLNKVILPYSSGFQKALRNIGEISNKGFEFYASGKILTGAFKWNLDGNISFNKTTVVKLYGGEDILGGTVSMNVLSGTISLLREGEEMSVFYGHVEDGYDENGNIKYKDLDGVEGITLDDRQIIGNPNPDFFYGINSHMSFKNFDFSMFFQGLQGNDLANVSKIGTSLVYGYGANLLKEVYNDHWTPQNTDAKYPKITSNQSMYFSDRNIEDGSYLRLRNVELAYTLPLEALNVNWLRKLQVYASGQNLLTITKYTGWDPDVNSAGSSTSIAQGIDHYSYPPSKSVTFGVRVGF